MIHLVELYPNKYERKSIFVVIYSIFVCFYVLIERKSKQATKSKYKTKNDDDDDNLLFCFLLIETNDI